jgi:hypothetical protein
MRRFVLAFICFFRILFGRRLPADMPPELLPAPPEPKALPEPKPKEIVVEKVVEKIIVENKPDPSIGALQLLGLFQREGRLVDFLSESIEAYDDAAIGAAVRDIHRGCKKVLEEHMGVEPVISGDENDSITVDKGFDPARIRLVGNVVGEPPFKGVLRHHGWRAVKVELPVPSDGLDQTVVAPAEVELG